MLKKRAGALIIVTLVCSSKYFSFEMTSEKISVIYVMHITCLSATVQQAPKLPFGRLQTAVATKQAQAHSPNYSTLVIVLMLGLASTSTVGLLTYQCHRSKDICISPLQ